MNWLLVGVVAISHLYVLMMGVVLGGLVVQHKGELAEASDWPWHLRLGLVAIVLFWPASVFLGWLLWDVGFWQKYRKVALRAVRFDRVFSVMHRLGREFEVYEEVVASEIHSKS